ncbi:hypothetical protein [Paenibacillus pabuli]|uniref:Uncharacterized protein n=1 Tax=Paenibacillus pabuli TaxID=1472 RepID=A0A855Y2C3_9BACL|nr:hypothetical protein [Paenibacillus pabuli]PWW35502.1 hypothetical protein DET56_11286 [Paenibacillus pabuli]PXW02831.1 hypothetical protein DEU73_111139 [Paenibacillus taichungensis]RAI96727.1 hypothetical protein DET54_10685 [Paenibacillus pabuli]
MLSVGVPKQKLLRVSLNSETSSYVDDKLGLTKRDDLKGAAFWRLGIFRLYDAKMKEAINTSVIKE